MTEPSDRDRAHTDPPDVVQVLVDNHRRFLRFVEGRIGDRGLAEEILQEAFVRGLNRVDQLQDQGSAVAWFYRMLRNSVIDAHRRQASSRRGLDAFATQLSLQAEPDEVLDRTVCQCVIALADTLKPEYAIALKRIDVDGLPVKDFALEAGISPSNAGVRVFRARQALRKQVARACGTCAEHGCLDCTCHVKPASTE
ncbi:MAG: sigma-70 family RNA polymerase sigma factor [Myxococcales bacterium]|nr:sigma-70 family RNA polymerase sigma factor [Myxococcales bacterium]